MKRVILMGLCMLVWSGEGLAVQTCKTTSITASTPTVDFVINGNGTVTHSKTGLTWKRCSEGQTWSGTTCTGTATLYNWQDALQQAQTLNNAGGYAGFTDWRVPNQKELSSIVETQCINPSINTTIFPATGGNSWSWSASPDAGGATGAWNVHFNDGGGSVVYKPDNYSVRLVRGGQ